MMFNSYLIDDLIAEGGTSKVYHAVKAPAGECSDDSCTKSNNMNMEYAIKICKKEPLYEHALMNEYDVLAKIRCGYTPKVYELSEYTDEYTGEESVAIVMEYIDGILLSDLLDIQGRDVDYYTQGVIKDEAGIGKHDHLMKQSRDQLLKNCENGLDIELIYDIMIAVCTLLVKMHSLTNPVYYCDIKPDNIIISKKGIRIIDFGSVYNDKNNSFYGTDVRFGTARYAAPEQFMRGEIIDARTDVYGAGMLFGIMCRKHLKRIPSINRIIKKCTRKDREKRYSEAAELLEDILDHSHRTGVVKQIVM